MSCKTTLLAAAVLALGGSGAVAAPIGCTLEALAALKIPDVTIVSAKPIPAGAIPEHCLVEASVITRGGGAPDGRAGMQLQLPTSWKQRFFFMGVGGNAGNFSPSANAVDRNSALGKGYAMAITDTGHKGDGRTADWVIGPDGKRDDAKVADFFHRAAHSATIAGKRLTEAFYAGRIARAYFDGCSTGGRMAMMEAERYPTDYDGIIAGDPAMDYRSTILRLAVQKAQLSSPAAYIPASLLPAVDRAVRAACDATDGVKDELIQNPARCNFKPEAMQCKAGQSTDCLSGAQAATLRAYITPLRDSGGRVVYPGMSVSDLAGPRGMPAWTSASAPPDMAKPLTPFGATPPAGWTFAREVLTYWFGLGPTARMEDFGVDPTRNTVTDAALRQMDTVFADGMTRDPSKLKTFVAQGRKMIMYHGLSDPAITPFRTMQFYEEFARTQKGYAKAQESVRLFMVPGMQHCSGGPGPDSFDTLSALENWVEHGIGPDGIIATATAPGATKRTMPLCMFPETAVYRGAGDVNDAGNWSCTANTGMLRAQGGKPKNT